jgi:polysaccharide biosynthesis/export protein
MEKIMKFKLSTRTTFFIALLSFPLFLYSQSPEKLDLNEDFLNSLPEETREELLEQLENDRADLSAVDFGAFSTLLDSNAAEKYIQQELLDHEQDKLPQLRSRESLQLFGADFFTGFPTSFMPISEPSLSSDYILDFGDSLKIDLYGPEDLSEILSVKSDGSITIPRIGKIQIAGLSMNTAQQKVSEFVTQKVTGSSVSISLETIRDMQVVIVGFAKVPGIYTVSGNSSVLSALKVAGGIGLGGSYRDIVVKRNDKEIAVFDLYDLFLRGNLTQNVALKAGDVILVRASKEIVAVYGGVKKPALFELNNENIIDILEYAGNSFDGSKLASVTLSTLTGNTFNTTTISEKDFADNRPKGGDEIYIPYIQKRYSDSVNIAGESSQPGVYSATSANSFLSDQEFFSPDAYKLAVVHKSFSRKDNKFFYNLHSPTNLPRLNSGDELIVLSKNIIHFLNSDILRKFMTTEEMPKGNTCQYFNKLYSLKSSSRFAESKLLFSTNGDLPQEFQEGNISPSNIIDTELLSNTSSSNLFEKKNDVSACLPIFMDDPELILVLLRNSILAEGKNLDSGIYPIASKTLVREFIDAVMLQKQFNADSSIALTDALETRYFSLSTLGQRTLSPGMNISISSKDSVIGGRVVISGEVNKPGAYFISSQDRLSSIIEMAGGYKESAYSMGGILTRESAKKLEKSFNEKLYNDTIKNLSSQLVQGENIPFDAVSFVLNEFKSIEPSGRVITEFNETLLAKDVSSDLILEPGDNIVIPKRSNVIYVFGEVLRPGPQSYNSKFSALDFIKQSGGFTSSVDKSAVIVVYPNGRSKLIKFGIFSSISRNDQILPGSVIYATRDFKKLNNLKLATTLAPIVSSIAISLASLNSISND